ncbi:L-threonylcarbamoyladenylate synthase [Kocuria sp.]|uniref:L-threonylcarbamoyladenylate synthase n=1 Tax=Kocuria sp. TaxID=1871328 RepID=UPI003F8D730A
MNQTPQENAEPQIGPEAGTGSEHRTGPEAAAPEAVTAEDAATEAQEQTQPAAVVYQCAQENQRAVGLKHAQQAVAADECVVIPTDTVYGIAANAFSAAAVEKLLAAKGRNRTMPPPVLIAHSGVLDGLADEVSAEARALAEAFWPGGLTLICHAQPSLQWDLGETQGTVALRVPDDEVARELLTLSGPLAVSSANKTGLPAATTAQEARRMLQDKVSVYLDAGGRGVATSGGSSAHPVVTRTAQPSTIVDCTGTTPVVVRDGAIGLARLREVVPSVIGVEGEEPPAQIPETTAAEQAQADHSDPEPSTDPVGAADGDDQGEHFHEGAALPSSPGSETAGTEAEHELAEARTEASESRVAHTPSERAEARSAAEVSAERKQETERGARAMAATRVQPSQAEALVLSGAGLAVSTTAGQTDPDQEGPSSTTQPGPDQNRRRTVCSRVAGQPQPVDRATAAALVASSGEDSEVASFAADQSRR